MGVEREDAGVRGDAQEEVEDDRRLLLERAGDGQPRVEALHQVLEHAVGVELLQILRRDGGIGVRRHRPELSDKWAKSDSGSWFADGADLVSVSKTFNLDLSMSAAACAQPVWL